MAAVMESKLSYFVKEAHSIIDDVNSRFASLSAQQLNWKPAADKWGVGQCLDHLINANAGYYQIFDEITAGQYKNSVKGIPIISRMLGRMVGNLVAPTSTRKVTAPKKFAPTSSNVPADIVEKFVSQQKKIVSYLNAMEGVDAAQLVIYSPVSKVVTYSLSEALTIIFSHERRHIAQAQRVIELPEFPGK